METVVSKIEKSDHTPLVIELALMGIWGFGATTLGLMLGLHPLLALLFGGTCCCCAYCWVERLMNV